MNTTEEQKVFMKELLDRVWQGIMKQDATPHLEWLHKQPTKLVRETLLATYPKGWDMLAGQYVESLTDEQAAMTLASIVATFVQAMPATKPA